MSDFQNYSFENPIFDQNDVGIFSWNLFLSSLVRWLLSLPGISINAALLYVSIMDNKLRSTCSLLLALGSACDFLYLLSYSVPFFLALFGVNFIRLFSCYFWQFLPNVGLFSSVWIVFFVGVDRLIAVIWPIRYTRIEYSPRIYIALMMFVTIGYSMYVLVLCAEWALFTYPNLPVTCTGVDILAMDVAPMALRNGLLINGASLCCYTMAAIALQRYRKHSPGSSTDSAGDKLRIFKSLAAIMVLVVGSYFATCAVALFTAQVQSPFYQLYVSPAISALLTCIAASSNAPVLFAFSRDYRRAFRKHLPRFVCGSHETNTVASNIQMADMATTNRWAVNTVAAVRIMTPINSQR